MKTQQIEVFSDAINAAVVRMPGRKFPGLVVQSDALIALDGYCLAIDKYAESRGDQELIKLVSRLRARLDEMRDAYREGVRNAGPWDA